MRLGFRFRACAAETGVQLIQPGLHDTIETS